MFIALSLSYPAVHFDHLYSNIRELLEGKTPPPYPPLDPEIMLLFVNRLSQHFFRGLTINQYLMEDVIKL